MSYVKQNFVDGNILTAAELNHIEDGIAAVEVDAAATKKEIDTLKKSKAEIDDTTIDGGTWSSKHIVNIFCPPLEENGNPVVYYPMAGYPLGVKVSWEPTQEGSGEPSPENIRPIQGRDSVTIWRTGENLLNPELIKYTAYNAYGIKIEYIGNNRVRLNGTFTSQKYSSFAILDTNQKVLSGKNLKITGFIVEGNELQYNLYGLRTKEETIIAMTALFDSGTVIDTTIEIVVSQDTPSAYTPYTGQDITITLPSTVNGGEVDAEGKGQETWGCIDSYAGETLPAEWICDRAAYAAGTTPPNGAQVAYKLDNPKPFTATGGGTILAISGTNTVLTDADSVTVISKADPIQTVSKLSERIAALETAAIPAHN